MLGLGQLGREAVENREVVARLEAGGRDEGTALDRAQRMLELGNPVGGIDVDQNQPGFGGRKLRYRPFRAVGRPNPDPITRFQAEAQQACAKLVGASLELGIGPPHALVRNHQRQPRAFAFRDAVEIRSDRVLNQRSRAVPPDVAFLRHYLPSNVISGGWTLASKALAVLRKPRCTSWVLKSSIVTSSIIASAAVMPPPDQAFRSVRVAA